MKYVDYLHDLSRSDSPVISDKMESPIPLVHTRAEVPGQDLDLERNEDHQFLMNHSVKDFSWSGLTVTVKDGQTKQHRDLINDITGDVQQGKHVQAHVVILPVLTN